MYFIKKVIYTKFQCLGGFQEVGRNAVLMETGSERILLDYGLKVEEGEAPIPPKGFIDAMLLSHPHLDHSGMVPTLKAPLYSTAAALDQARLLLFDSIKVGKIKGMPERFKTEDVERMRENRVTYGQQFEVGRTIVDVFDSGHVPGSAGFLLETNGKKVFYSGDFRLSNTRLLNGARINVKNIDVLFTETTYAFKDHAPREEVEKRLIELVKETIERNGTAIIPTFAVGRAAELLMVLDSYGIKYPVFLDGMAKQATEISLRYPELLRDYDALRKAVEDVVPLYTNADREMAMKKPSVIITTSGMLSGGPVIHFLKKKYDDPNSSLIFTGFQVPDTPGRVLLDTGHYIDEENKIDLEVKMKTHYLDFSAHAGRTELMGFINNINPGKVVCMHGDRTKDFAEELRGKGFDAIAPGNGDEFEV